MLPALALRLRVRVLLALLAAAAVCLLATPAVRKFACKLGAMDLPGESRRVHDHPIPRLGGLALFAGFLAGVLPFTGIDEPVQGILLGSVIIVVTGAVDDVLSLRPWVKLVLQLAAAFVAIEHGVVIRILTNPSAVSAETIALGALSVPVTLVWIVGMTNALNLIDGLDGLAAGVCGSLAAIGPRYCGEITIAQFAANFNRSASQLSTQNAGKLTRDGVWTSRMDISASTARSWT